MAGKNISQRISSRRLRASTTRRILATGIILFVTLFLATSNFAAIRNLSKKTVSITPSRSMKLSGKGTPALSISPSVISVSPEASSGTVNVLNAAREEWSVSNTVAWITVSVPASRGEPNQQITYSVNPNTSCAKRVGVFYVKTKAVTISQAGVSADYALSSSTAAFPAAGGGRNVALSANCLWRVQSDANWITVISPQNGSDTTTISYLVSENNGNTARSGSVRIYDGNSVLRGTLAVSQSSVPPSHALSESNAVFASTGGNGSVNLAALAPWSVQTDVPWISGLTPVSGDGDATISYTISENPDSSARSGRIKILDANSVVKQILVVGQSSANANYSLSSSGATFSANGGGSNVQLYANSTWTIQSDASWISGFSQTSGVGDRSIGYSVASNPGCTARTGLIKILDGNSVVQKKLTVTQAGISGEYALSSTYLLFPSNGGRISVGVSAKCSWTVQTDVSWISNIAPSAGNGAVTVYYTVADNSTTEGRQGFIRLLDAEGVVQQTLKVVQTGQAPAYWLHPTSAGFSASASSNNVISLTANATWYAQADADWITGLNPTSGNTNALIRYNVSANANSSSRVGSIKIYDAEFKLQETFSVVQSGASGASASRPSESYTWSAKSEDGTVNDADDDGNLLSSGTVNGMFYIGKTAPDGTVLWVKWLKGGAGQPSAILADPSGAVYVAGQYEGAINFGGTALAGSDADIFVVKYSADGAHLWSKSFGGTGEDSVETMALDQGNVLVVGSFASRIRFDETTENELANNGSPSIFFADLSGADGQHVWSQQLGDFSNPQANGAIMNYLSRAAQQ